MQCPRRGGGRRGGRNPRAVRENDKAAGLLRNPGRGAKRQARICRKRLHSALLGQFLPLQDSPRGPQDRPKTSQDGPTTTQEAPKTAHEAPRTAPRGSPYGGPERTYPALRQKGAQEAPTRLPRDPKSLPRGRQTTPERLPRALVVVVVQGRRHRPQGLSNNSSSQMHKDI